MENTQSNKERELSRRKKRRKNNLIGYSFILPNFIGFFVFTLIPIVASFFLSFMEWDAFTTPEFIGLENFRNMIQSETFWIALKNTFYYAVGTIPVTLIVALGLALLLNKKLPGIQYFRAAVFFPYVASLVAVAVVWSMLFHPQLGPINQFLAFLGVENLPGWLASSDWAMPAVIIVSIWKNMGYYMVLFLAGLQSIPREIYEAAEIDGANKRQQFFNVTLPSLRPTTFLVTIMLTISSFKVFDLIQVMTEGGPGRATTVLVYQIYNEAFVKFNFGYSSALALVLFVIVLAVTLFQFRIQDKYSD